MTRTTADAVRRIGIKLAALAQDGLAFAADAYDVDRYQQAGRLAAELLSALPAASSVTGIDPPPNSAAPCAVPGGLAVRQAIARKLPAVPKGGAVRTWVGFFWSRG